MLCLKVTSYTAANHNSFLMRMKKGLMLKKPQCPSMPWLPALYSFTHWRL